MNIELGNLPKGQYRDVTEAEMQELTGSYGQEIKSRKEQEGNMEKKRERMRS